MSASQLIDRTAAVGAALAQLQLHAQERVLIMLPDGPGFAESFTATVRQGAVPLPVNPLLSVDDVVAVAAAAGARLVVTSPARIPVLAELDTEPPVLVEGPRGCWAAALRLQ